MLDAALRAGINFSYSCKSGCCGCKISNGCSSLLHSEESLMEYEKKGGSILACVCFAKSGLLLDVVDLGAKVLPTSQILSCKISQINRLAADVIQVLLRLPSASEFSFSRLIC